MWNYRGQKRPDFAEEPGPDQESVWDYPRPPALVTCNSLVEVKAGDRVVACTRAALRLLETASPPTYYLPPDDVDLDQLVRTQDSSFCEWKGRATYWALARHPSGTPVGWSYEDPDPRYAGLHGYLSFYPARLECYVDGERVRPQAGAFYGGWVTDNIVGPMKGPPGTGHW